MKKIFSPLSILPIVALCLICACKKNVTPSATPASSSPGGENKTVNSLQKDRNVKAAFYMYNDGHMCGTYLWTATDPLVYNTIFKGFAIHIINTNTPTMPGGSVLFTSVCVEILKSGMNPSTCSSAWNTSWNKALDDLLDVLNSGNQPTGNSHDFVISHVSAYLMAYGGRVHDDPGYRCRPVSPLNYSTPSFCP